MRKGRGQFNIESTFVQTSFSITKRIIVIPIEIVAIGMDMVYRFFMFQIFANSKNSLKFILLFP